MKQPLFAVTLLAALACSAARSQTSTEAPYKPKPAFPGQTEAPAPARASAPFVIQTITNRLSAPWSLAFLPDGNFLVTEGAGSMRIVRPDGVVSAPIAGVPGVKVVAAQGLHDVLLDPYLQRTGCSTSPISRRRAARIRPFGRTSFTTSRCGPSHWLSGAHYLSGWNAWRARD